MNLTDLRKKLDAAETTRLSPTACLSSAALRRNPDPTAASDHRQSFQVDADRILHSLAYTRYIDKTQVFYLVRNDHITHRVLHVQLVAKISRTIGRLLGLNEDLIEAIALGHDLGHAPFGHDGESYLSAIGRAHGLPPFLHALQSVRALDVLEKQGRGLNLSLQVLDAILCHDGEVDITNLVPDRAKTFADLAREIAQKEAEPKAPLRPMTREGCVVRLADTIAYIGRDIDDAIRLGLINRADLPAAATDVLGRTNGTIVFRLVEDLISHSAGKEAVGFSARTAEALTILKRFNYEHIYLNPRIKIHGEKIKRLFEVLFEACLAQLASGSPEGPLSAEFLRDMTTDYAAQTQPALKVRDYIAGMTDEYFLRVSRDLLLPDVVL